jgi:DMSO/TMAO reductase YedYZ molybdopterin-dependent catalytic subunit
VAQDKPDPEIPPKDPAGPPSDDETAEISRTSLQRVAAGAGRKKASDPDAKAEDKSAAGERFLSEKEFKRMNRREVLKLTPIVLAGAFAVGKFREPLLTRGVAFSDWAAGAIFRKSALASTFGDAQVAPFEKFPYNGYDVIDPEVDLENWTLTVEGNVQKPGEYRLAQIQALPKITQNTRHVCVEGWDVIGNFGGARVADFLQLIGADPHARFVEVECADDYYESLDMASMLQPQSLMCYEMYGKPLDRGHGAPVRLQMPTKLGYKQAKYLTTFRVTNVLKPEKRGYWEDQGYSWHGGL